MTDNIRYILDKYNKEYEPVVKIREKRSELARLFRELDYKIGAEIGVAAGHFSEALCYHNPGLKLYCIDSWRLYEDYYFLDPKRWDNIFESAQIRLHEYSVELIRAYSNVAESRFKNGELDFVYIDANHSYKYALEDITIWSEKVRPGGIVSGHDYVNRKNVQEPIFVKDAVDHYVQSCGIEPLFLMAWERSPSWFYVKS